MKYRWYNGLVYRIDKSNNIQFMYSSAGRWTYSNESDVELILAGKKLPAKTIKSYEKNGGYLRQ